MRQQPTQSIVDQLQRAVPGLASDWIITESDGDVVISLHVSDPIAVDNTLKAKNFIILAHTRRANAIFFTNGSV